MLDILTDLGLVHISCNKSLKFLPIWRMSLTIEEEEYSELKIEHQGDTFQEVVAHIFNRVKSLSGE